MPGPGIEPATWVFALTESNLWLFGPLVMPQPIEPHQPGLLHYILIIFHFIINKYYIWKILRSYKWLSALKLSPIHFTFCWYSCLNIYDDYGHHSLIIISIFTILQELSYFSCLFICLCIGLVIKHLLFWYINLCGACIYLLNFHSGDDVYLKYDLIHLFSLKFHFNFPC